MNDNDATTDKNTTQGIHPDELMADISRSSLSKTLPISLGTHLAVILLTSIPFLVLCVRYGTMDPFTIQAAMQQEQPDGRDTSAEPLKQADEPAGETAPSAAPQPEAQPDKSAIEREVEKTDSSRPTEPSISLEDELDG